MGEGGRTVEPNWRMSIVLPPPRDDAAAGSSWRDGELSMSKAGRTNVGRRVCSIGTLGTGWPISTPRKAAEGAPRFSDRERE